MSKTDMKAFQRRDKKTPKPQPTEEQASARVAEKTVASPSLQTTGKRRAVGVKKVERKILRMPISKNDVELTAVFVSPAECLIHPKNRRIQSLLRESNPTVMELKKSMMEEGQREPVLARHIIVDGEKKVEIIDGSRRRFVAELISQQEDIGFKLKIWLGREIPDLDAEYLTKVENELQEEISVWETAQYLRGVSEANPDWSNVLISHNESMAETSVSDYLALSEVPMEIVERLESPNVLALRSGVPLMRILNKLDEKSFNSLIVELKGEDLFRSSKDLLKSVSEFVKVKTTTKKPTTKKKIEIKRGDVVRAEVGKNRSKEGQYKLDLYDVTDDEYEKLMEAVKKILG